MNKTLKGFIFYTYINIIIIFYERVDRLWVMLLKKV
jgi:hypothetical protein